MSREVITSSEGQKKPSRISAYIIENPLAAGSIVVFAAAAAHIVMIVSALYASGGPR